MPSRAAGPFDVKLVPQAPDAATGGEAIGRFALDKRFHGDLDAASVGQMLAVRGEPKDSAGYVAMELVTGTLHGRAGNFALQHSGTMHAGTQQLVIGVVPGSGTGSLAGLAGTMQITIAEGGKHAYSFDYTLPAAP
jgi:hypothetical protein